MPISVTIRGNQQKKKKKKKKKWSVAASQQQTVSTAREERPTTLQVSSNGLNVNPRVQAQDAKTDLPGLG
ncbi:hypothetical protein, partial [Alcaligenes phenolicus]|uniref:hypothetical protein n=1 Tax=Alcaligenes phenolicus TaxID=232846 RepID=UPI002AA7E517